ncbi:MAG: hypothetical protein KIT33_03360 [Candidatus Kapabacteria bacterium]|nr:hypothetical protein [Ignavibacteriota bacterium]MCW5883989.1 hypothetical protein [Candidatus Kapabacteria bacterium]
MIIINKILSLIFSVTILFIVSSCDGGLAPRKESDKSVLNGKIKFVKGNDNWPPEDSVFAIRAAAFKEMPDSNIILAILGGNAYFTGESLPMYQDSINFTFDITEAPVNLVYIVAVWQYTPDILSQRVIGVYTETGDKTKASQLMIEKGNTYNIEIEVDFDDLPPMPF